MEFSINFDFQKFNATSWNILKSWMETIQINKNQIFKHRAYRLKDKKILFRNRECIFYNSRTTEGITMNYQSILTKIP